MDQEKAFKAAASLLKVHARFTVNKGLITNKQALWVAEQLRHMAFEAKSAKQLRENMDKYNDAY